MKKITINSAIELVNTLRARLEDMKQLRDRNMCDIEESYGEKITRRTTLFDPTVVDEKVVKLQNAIRTLNAAIKESNVMSKIDVEIDENELLAPIQKR